jgi:hypothetical protein
MSHNRRLEIGLLIVILIVAFALRLAALDDIPPGLTHDEAGHGHDAIAILNGARPIYLTVGYGREPLYDYLNAAAMSIFGPTALTLRLTSAAAGFLLIPLVYVLVRQLFDARVALAAAALIAVSFWPLAVSRQALRSTLLPTLLSGAAIAYWRLFQYLRAPEAHLRKRLIALAGFTLCIAATLYTYIPARILWTIFVFFLVYLAILHRSDLRRLTAPTLIGVAMAGLLAWPMFDYLNTHPGAEARLSMLDAPLQALQRGDLSVVLNQATSAISAWFLPGRGDDFLAYTIRGRPVFDPVTFALFLVGLILCLRNIRQPQYAFLLIWFAIGVSPSLLTGNDASMTRSVGAMPVFYTLPALAVVWLARTVGGSAVERRPSVYLVFAALVAITAVYSVNDYFNVWGQSPDVRAAYQHTITQIAESVRDVPGDIVISTVYPIAPHDPYVAQVTLSRDRPPFRWFDARTALIVPSVPATLVIPASTPPDPYWNGLIGRRLERVALRPDDLDPYFDLYAWDTAAAAEQALALAAPLAHNFGDAVELIGVDLHTPRLRATDTVALVTFWRVIDPARVGPRGGAADASDAVLFTHALDASGAIVGQQDSLDAPSWSWQAGDLVAQIHRFRLHTPPASRTLSLEVGVYDRASGTRLPLIVDGQALGDSVSVGSIEVAP